MTTTLLYLEAPFCYEASARITATIQNGTLTIVELDATIFYPQGGGQPCDTGTIRGSTCSFAVDRVTHADDRVIHEGRVTAGAPAVGDTVSLSVDVKRRQANAALQSGGHLLLNAMRDVGQTLVATKGYHFPDGPYVEFAGAVPETERVSLRERLQREVDRLIDLDVPIVASMIEPSELRNVCAHVPVNVPRDRPTRVVTIDHFSQPCGGTHVDSTRELRGLKVGKIRSKRGDTRVSYVIDSLS
jgi:Ser-tRNA(Ala) deacylase AlaX